MKRHNGHLALWALLVSGVLAGSCAVDGGVGHRDGALVPPAPQMDAARLGLAPALRPFYDALEEFGDWVLVEPQGWVFRPRVNTVAWRPYQDGNWEPSYTFGWVWTSNEPFGWITDHYGFWFHDDFQGWVWQPYGAWAPSWVAWVQVGDFVGWAPLAPEGTASYDKVPGGVFTYVPLNALAQRNAGLHATYVKNVPDDSSELRPIERVSSYRGVHWNAGPDLGEVLGMAAADRLRIVERDDPAATPAPPRGPAGESRDLDMTMLQDRTRRVWGVARREFTVARSLREAAKPGTGSPTAQPAPPVRPRLKPGPAREPVSPDSTAIAPGDSLRRVRKGGKPGAPPLPDSGID